MKFPFSCTSTVAAIVVAAGLSGSILATAPQAIAAKDPVVARVNGKEIKRSDVAAAQQLLPEQYRSIPLQSLYPALIAQMIDARLVAGAARNDGLHKDPEVRRRLAMIENRILEEAFVRRSVAAKVTDAAVRKRYQEMIREPSGESQIRARHILVKSRAEAQKIIDELRKPGVDFAAMAKKHSTGPSGPRGGDLGYFGRSSMVKPFADAAFDLKPGQVTSRPVQTQFGWHVIKVEDRRAAPVPTFEASEAKLRQELVDEEMEKTLKRLRGNARIEQFNLDGSAMAPKRAIQRVP